MIYRGLLKFVLSRFLIVEPHRFPKTFGHTLKNLKKKAFVDKFESFAEEAYLSKGQQYSQTSIKQDRDNGG